jgi:uncharacterized protein YqhQ
VKKKKKKEEVEEEEEEEEEEEKEKLYALYLLLSKSSIYASVCSSNQTFIIPNLLQNELWISNFTPLTTIGNFDKGGFFTGNHNQNFLKTNL